MPELVKIVIDDTRLVQLIQQTKDKRPARIVADGVEYGIYVEMGTEKAAPGLLGKIGKKTTRMAAQPFMRPAAEAVRPGFTKAFKIAGSNFGLADQVVQKAAENVERLAKQYAAVDTGALRASIHIVKGEKHEVEFEKLSGGKVIG